MGGLALFSYRKTDHKKKQPNSFQPKSFADTVINQPTNQPANQPTNQPTNSSTNRAGARKLTQRGPDVGPESLAQDFGLLLQVQPATFDLARLVAGLALARRASLLWEKQLSSAAQQKAKAETSQHKHVNPRSSRPGQGRAGTGEGGGGESGGGKGGRREA